MNSLDRFLGIMETKYIISKIIIKNIIAGNFVDSSHVNSMSELQGMQKWELLKRGLFNTDYFIFINNFYLSNKTKSWKTEAK